MRCRAAAVFLAALAAIAGTAPAAAQTTLRFGQIPSTVRSVSTLSMFVSERNGLFAREGIAVEKVLIPGGTDKMVAALDQGRIDITQSATPYLINAVQAGSDAVAIASETANPIYSLIVKPEVTSFADLKGRVLGLSLAVDTISISHREILALTGIEQGDYELKELGGTTVPFDSPKKGDCDGVPLGQ